MSTRGFVGIRDADRTIASYNHSDSYPTWLGVQVATFLRDTPIPEIADRFKAVTVVDENNELTPEDIGKLDSLGFEEAHAGDWYSVLRDKQGDLAEYLRLGFMPVWDVATPGAMITAADSWLEWGYIVDLVEYQLVVYKMVSHAPPRRFETYSFAQLNGHDDLGIRRLMDTLENKED